MNVTVISDNDHKSQREQQIWDIVSRIMPSVFAALQGVLWQATAVRRGGLTTSETRIEVMPYDEEIRKGIISRMVEDCYFLAETAVDEHEKRAKGER